MNRLDRIREALEQLTPTESDDQTPAFHPHISSSVLGELVECFYYIFFPECTNPPSQVTPTYTDPNALMEWVLGHVADMLTAQIYFAFVLHGDVHAVEDVTKFVPLKTAQRTQLDWNGANSKTLRFFSMEGNGDAQPEKPKEQPAENPLPVANVPPAVKLGSHKNHDSVVLFNAASHNLVSPREEQAMRTLDCHCSEQNRSFLANCKKKADAIVTKFLVERLTHVRWLLHTDVEAIFKGDVAASSPSEVVLCYPAVRCMVHQRMAHQLYLLGVPQTFTRVLTEMAHSKTGIDIHPHTPIGHHFFIDHGTGIVIGATAIIGNYVSIYQGVTLGARSFPTDKKTGEKIRDLPRHPVIQDHVTLYANAVVLGRITIGEHSTIGGNCWVVRDVPPFTSIVQKSAHVLTGNERMFLENYGSGI